MARKNKPVRPRARLPKGFRDIRSTEALGLSQMLERIGHVYHLYGFEALDTSTIEYTDALGKFLPDVDRPNAGVFSFQDDDGQWLSLRYDLTAPLARFVAEHYDALPKPFRRYHTGTVWRNEKPGPGRFRQFTQFDADTVGAPGVAADAELCMMAADCLEALGMARGDYVIRINHRKLLDALLKSLGLLDEGDEARRLTILRAMDKYDRLGREGVALLLGKGRKDESGDFTKGAGLDAAQAEPILAFLESDDFSPRQLGGSALAAEGLTDVRQMQALFDAAGYGPDRVRFDPSIVRGLDYYTGPVFEAELTFEAKDDKGRPVRFGSVGGGGRYDGLVARFKGIEVPATGFSLGVSRLYAALAALGKIDERGSTGPVVILVMDKQRMADYQTMAFELREAGIRAEVYMGGSGMRAQMKYADKRGAPLVVIEGGDELARGEVTIKDLVLGAQKSREITDNEEWRSGRPAQVNVPRSGLVTAITNMLNLK
jgi:histidyl-tRNA synthetase